jgi:hypothetical protein
MIPMTWEEVVELFTEAFADWAEVDDPEDVEIWRNTAEVAADVMQREGWIK